MPLSHTHTRAYPRVHTAPRLSLRRAWGGGRPQEDLRGTSGNGPATGRQRAGNGPGRWAAIGARPAKFIWGPTGRPADPAPTGRVHSQLQPRHQTTGILINSQLQFLQTSAWPETVASEIPRHDRDTTATRPRQVSGSPGLPGIEGTTAPTGNSSGPLSRINECLYPRGIPGNHC